MARLMQSPRFFDLLSEAILLKGSPDDIDLILKAIGEAHFVLLGEATHGTHEFYKLRAEISKRLISQKGFKAVALEADWPDAYRVNQFIRNQSQDTTAHEALDGFKRFPTWMWRNADVLDFVGWLRNYNDQREDQSQKAGFYGLDLYSLYSSVEAVIYYLEKIDPQAARRARNRYGCFDLFGQDPQTYARSTFFNLDRSCEDQVIQQLNEMNRQAINYMSHNGYAAEEEYFSAIQNARLIKNAEQYYRTLFAGDVSSWNLRDQHMFESFQFLTQHFQTKNPPAKIIVWAHNSHLGNAKATQMGEEGEINLGQLIKEKFEQDAVSIGFTTYHGTVTAAHGWGGAAQRMNVLPALKGSYEDLFHQTGLDKFWLNLRDSVVLQEELGRSLLERAIGVVYLPRTERWSHYFNAFLPQQFDLVIHFDETRAVEPLETRAGWEQGDLPETYPTGI